MIIPNIWKNKRSKPPTSCGSLHTKAPKATRWTLQDLDDGGLQRNMTLIIGSQNQRRVEHLPLLVLIWMEIRRRDCETPEYTILYHIALSFILQCTTAYYVGIVWQPVQPAVIVHQKFRSRCAPNPTRDMLLRAREEVLLTCDPAESVEAPCEMLYGADVAWVLDGDLKAT